MKLIIPHDVAELIEPRVAEAAPQVSIVHIDREGEADGPLDDAEIFLRWWTPRHAMERVLEAAPQLRWLHTPSAGVDGLLLPQIRESEIVVTNSAGAHAIPIAEFVLMYMLAHVKQARALAALGPENAWPRGRQMHLGELYGKTLLVIGLGSIGGEVARRAAAFGMRVIGSRRRPSPVEGAELVVGEGEWRDALPEADFVLVAAPLTEATRGMVDAAAFARLRPGAYLMNIARGEIVDTGALLAALRDERLSGAALDALPEEPLPPEHPLWQAPNVWITPHISWSSPHSRERTSAIFLENLGRYLRGEPLLNVVDKAAGY